MQAVTKVELHHVQALRVRLPNWDRRSLRIFQRSCTATNVGKPPTEASSKWKNFSPAVRLDRHSVTDLSPLSTQPLPARASAAGLGPGPCLICSCHQVHNFNIDAVYCLSSPRVCGRPCRHVGAMKTLSCQFELGFQVTAHANQPSARATRQATER